MNAIGTIDRPKPSIAPPLDDEPLYEIVDGQIVQIPRMGALSNLFASRLVNKIINFADQNNLGQAVVETLFRLALPVDRNRRPDVAFVSFQRWPKDNVQGLDQNAWEVTPNLAVEFVSKHDEAEALQIKIKEYFAAGVQLVWVIFPPLSLVHVYSSFTDLRVLTRQDTLDGGAVLPGFSLPLGDFFPATLGQLPPTLDNDG